MRWSLRQQMLLGFGAIIAIFIANAVYGILTARDIEAALSANAQQNSLIQRVGINFRGSVHDRAIAVRDAILANDAAELSAQVTIINKLADNYATNARELSTLIAAAPAQVSTMVEDIKRVETQTLALTKSLLEHKAADRIDEAQVALDQAAKLYEQWLAAINRLIDFEEERIASNNTRALDDAARLGVSLLVLTAIAAAVGVAAALIVSGRVLRELGAEPDAVRSVVNAMQGGDLTVPIATAAGDTKSVMAAVRDMQTHFRALVAQVHANVGSLEGTSSEIDQGYQSLGARTQQVHASLDETASSMEALTRSVNQSAQSAAQADELAIHARQAADAGGKVMEQVIHTMGEIDASSKKINDIIDVIDSIAFQTNILALNAAVEAARAGEQGRGFAVVAAEVRSLAQRSASAAKEIAQLIQTSVDKIGSGSAQVHQAGQAMDGIVEEVQRVSAIIGEISASAADQSQGIARVNSAVAQIDQMTQQNTQLASASGQAVAQLRSQAQELMHAVSQFRIGGAQAAPRAAAVPTTTARAPKAAPAVKSSSAKPAAAAPKAAAPAPAAPKAAPAAPAAVPPSLPAPAAAPRKAAAAGSEDDWESF